MLYCKSDRFVHKVFFWLILHHDAVIPHLYLSIIMSSIFLGLFPDVGLKKDSFPFCPNWNCIV